VEVHETVKITSPPFPATALTSATAIAPTVGSTLPRSLAEALWESPPNAFLRLRPCLRGDLHTRMLEFPKVVWFAIPVVFDPLYWWDFGVRASN
jgi:hypothetical protein